MIAYYVLKIVFPGRLLARAGFFPMHSIGSLE